MFAKNLNSLKQSFYGSKYEKEEAGNNEKICKKKTKAKYTVNTMQS